jgi:WD40 repeat protein/serine/threonine protein kinase
VAVKPAPIESILAAAVEVDSDVERRKFLDQACAGDAELKRRVEQLIANHFRAGRFLESPAAELFTAADDPRTEQCDSVIGPYRLLEQIGEGGFGIVFMAEQQQPVRRKVALKVLKPGMDTRQVVARFEAERQALALMDHPHIAHVLDAGATESGRPYFVMELIRGIPLTVFCDESRLTLRERLELFVTVCQAVHHAHQKGIIHRDLKPSNVLVTLRDGKPEVKVIDFGIAKALGQERLTEKTLCTGFAQMLGTPLYMSPEQAELSGQDVDTRTDIYALGVLLYELLTGTTPFDKERMKEASYDEIRRIIREEEPVKPSTRMSTLGQAATTVSANRKSEPKPLSKLFRGELDWIVMKALEKDRNRRYDAASSFAADVRRYLGDEPVQACPPSAWYRLRKFARRNKVALITASAIAIVILLAVAGLAFSTTLTWQANKELRLERGRAEEQTQLARRLLYASDINVARQAWEEGNLTRARELLERQRPQPGSEDLRGFEWRYLWRLCRDSSLHTLAGHTRGVNAVRFSPDGKMIASASNDGTVRLWDVGTRREIVPLRGHEESVNSLAFAPDGKTLATAGYDGLIILWDMASRQRVDSLRPKGGLTGVAFTPDGKILASCNADGRITRWDVTSRQEVDTLSGYSWSRVAFSPDGRFLAAGSYDSTVRLWELATRKENSLRGHTAYVIGLAFSPNGKALASAGNDATVRLWDLATKQEVYTLRGHTAPIDSLAYSPDGKILVTGGGDSTVKLWDMTSWQEVRTLRGHTSPVTAVAFSPDGETLVTGSWDNTIKLWDIATKGEPNFLAGHEGSVYSLTFSPDGRTLASGGGYDQTVKLWDLASGRQVALTGNQGQVWSVAFSPSGHTLATTSRGDRTVRLWDVATRRQLARFAHQFDVRWAAFSADGKMVIANDGDRLRLWDIATGRERAAPLPGCRYAFSPDGKTLAIGGADGTIRLWDIRSWETIAALAGHPAITEGRAAHTADAISGLAFSPDGQMLASTGRDLTVRLWNLATGREIACLKGHTDSIWTVAFAPDGKTVATCSRDGTVKLWNLTVQAEAATLKGHQGQVVAVAFAPGGNLLATAGTDGKIRLWRASPFSETDAPGK